MNFCDKTANIWQIVGNIILIVKIIVPLIIIIIGMVELGRATISSDEKAISKAAITLIRRVVLGLIIFFIPSLVRILFNMVSGFNDDIKKDFKNCFYCITNPNKTTPNNSDDENYCDISGVADTLTGS